MTNIVGKIKEKIQEKVQRHKLRNSALNYKYVISDSIEFIQTEHWDVLTEQKSIFLSRRYLNLLEKCSPSNTQQRYAIAYSEHRPVAALVCQVADISGECLVKPDERLGQTLVGNYKERVLVCGNLISSGLHGVAFADDFSLSEAWKIVAEVLYKIRRSEKLSGSVDFVLIKDFKGKQVETSEVIEQFSYRRIQTDPDMVLDLGEGCETFDDYLHLLNSKYRSRIKKIARSIDEAGLICRELRIDEIQDKILHALYLQVEQQSKTRLATIPNGYFNVLAQGLGDDFICWGILDGDVTIGFISVIRDREDAVAYYVGFDYQRNEESPIYFRLLQLVIESAIKMGCKRVLFGRSALEPKANLGAKPIDTYVWARHRIPSINFFVRQVFCNIPFDDAPERNVIKKS